MTTAHRPTWKAAVGQDDSWTAGGLTSAGRSVYAAPAHTTLKYRHGVENKKEALKKSLLALEEVETSALEKIRNARRPLDPALEERAQQRLLKQTADVDEVALKAKYDDSDVDDSGEGGRAESEESDLDADDSDLDASLSSDDEDDEAALQAELAKIRAEREALKKKEQDQLELEENEKQEEAALIGNPLLNDSFGKQIKRKWNDGEFNVG